MGICEVLTIIFVIAKILGKLDWEWVYVFMPMIVEFGLWFLAWIVSFFSDRF